MLTCQNYILNRLEQNQLGVMSGPVIQEMVKSLTNLQELRY